MAKDPEHLAHLEWIGYVQPVGLVVSVPGLLAAQAHANRNIAPEHQRFLACLPRDKEGQVIPDLRDFTAFTQSVLGWEKGDLTPFPTNGELPSDLAQLEAHLAEYNETLRPTHVIREFKPRENQSPWVMLIQCLPENSDLDKPVAAHDRGWVASPQSKFERLLRETGVPAGLLVTSNTIRLVYAPRGENSGYATFSIPEMAQVAGRPIFAALHMLLCSERLFSLPEAQRLPAILAESRKYQNTVSTQLAEQVLAALYELLRGFQAANDARHGELLRQALADDPDKVYSALLTVLMRLVFVLYAEDRNLLSSDPIYANNYSVTGLFNHLRADAGRYPDTMDLRYGAWAQLLTLFRLIHDGGSHSAMRIQGREGYLFDPDRYPFLEGQPSRTTEASAPTPKIPRVSDGVVWRVLSNLLILDGERLSYRTLDVEEIGSVYQTIMGFRLEVAAGQTIALKGKRKHKGEVPAPICINLDGLLATKPADRKKWLQDQTDQKFEGGLAKEVEDAASIPDLLAALERKTDRNATPSTVAAGGLLLQPTDERRRSGSHYTPRSFTEPIVRKTLAPILKRLGERPTPAQLLELKIADIAIGSGAFQVETCRQLADELVKAWHHHRQLPTIPPDEDEVLHARRIIAQRCLYGLDRNQMAVDLAKLSLWLATLAKDHPFTFLDHAIRCGDSLVGFTRKQLGRFHWDDETEIEQELGQQWIDEDIRKATAARLAIINETADSPDAVRGKLDQLERADAALTQPRLIGKLLAAACFSADSKRPRLVKREEMLQLAIGWMRKRERGVEVMNVIRSLEADPFPVAPFNWDIEFPEVFERVNGGFDAIVGNPPFIGGRRVRSSLGDVYFDWLLLAHADSSGNADLVAHFFRQAFKLLRADGCFGLIATNTIGQGDTRATGLRWICTQGGTVHSAQRRVKWPGQAAVVVSVVWVTRGNPVGPFDLDGRPVPVITAYLFHAGGHENPASLQANANKSFQGSIVLGMGFTFDDTDSSGVASPLSLMQQLIAKDTSNKERVFPYIGGEEVNDSPTHAHHRYVINFADFPLRRDDLEETWEDADDKQRATWLRSGIVPLDYPDPVAADWPDLLAIVEQKVKPERTRRRPNGEFVLRDPLPRRWWQYADKRPDLSARLQTVQTALVISRVTHQFGFAPLSANMVFSDSLVVLPSESISLRAVVQSTVHEVWSRFFASSLEERLRYTPSDCFETFPFPKSFETNTALETAGREYYKFRAALMVMNNEGLTKTYNRFHDPDERSPDILKLRELHAAMDAAVLTAYGWADLIPQCQCEFLLDYEDGEDDEEETGGRKKKKPWRYRWSDDVRDEVLARLLKLNAERAEQEKLTGQAAGNPGKSTEKNAARTKRGRKKKDTGAAPQPDLINPPQGDLFNG